ncbi:Nuclear mitotic apparatus protein 1 [Labeo rohita]|uniref:Nuclear mitotic apparatus protein 1 n=1 Tax=Labeo rohita TaxID=84645 RepID=A0ABQ8M3V9_LABRO|nr:Nuclear mitotic apparatus protein 1 [Labeo rohita]
MAWKEALPTALPLGVSKHWILDLIDFVCELPILPSSSELLNWEEIPPNLPLPPPLIDLFPASMLILLDPVSPSATPQPTICGMGSPLSGGSLDSDSSLRGPDSASVVRPSGSTIASSSLVSTGARQSTSSTGLPHPSGSALVSRPPTSTSGLHSSGCTSSFRPSGSIGLLLPSSFTSVLCHSGSTMAFRISVYASVAEATCSTLALRILGVTQDRRLSVSVSPPPAPPSVCPLESSALPPPWFLPPSAPPWATIMAVAWVLPGSSCSKSLLSSPWLLPPSDPLRTLLSSPWLLPPSSPPWSPSSTRASSGTDFLPALRYPLSPSHIYSFVLSLCPPPSLPFFSTSGRGGQLSHP